MLNIIGDITSSSLGFLKIYLLTKLQHKMRVPISVKLASKICFAKSGKNHRGFLPSQLCCFLVYKTLAYRKKKRDSIGSRSVIADFIVFNCYANLLYLIILQINHTVPGQSSKAVIGNVWIGTHTTRCECIFHILSERLFKANRLPIIAGWNKHKKNVTSWSIS